MRDWICSLYLFWIWFDYIFLYDIKYYWWPVLSFLAYCSCIIFLYTYCRFHELEIWFSWDHFKLVTKGQCNLHCDGYFGSTYIKLICGNLSAFCFCFIACWRCITPLTYMWTTWPRVHVMNEKNVFAHTSFHRYYRLFHAQNSYSHMSLVCLPLSCLIVKDE